VTPGEHNPVAAELEIREKLYAVKAIPEFSDQNLINELVVRDDPFQ
jgi:hypothetical protein